MTGRIKLLKFLDKTAGKFINLFLKEKHLETVSSLERVLFIRPGGLGDAVLLTPAILNLKSVFPEAEIDILAEKRNYQILKIVPEINRIYCYDKPQDFLKIITRKYDIVIDTEQWHRLSSILARFIGKITVGFSTNERRKNLDIKVEYSHSRYEIESFLDLLRALLEHLKRNRKLTYNIPFIKLSGKTDKRFDVAIFTGATIKYRKWDIMKYRELIKRLTGKGLNIVVIGAKNDVKFNRMVCSGFENIEDFSGKTNLIETAYLIATSKVLFSTDSGILHIGVALGIPTISLFGPGIEEKWGPKGKKDIVINKHLPCSPCTRFGYTPKCKINAKCIKDIETDEVYNATMRLLNV